MSMKTTKLFAGLSALAITSFATFALTTAQSESQPERTEYVVRTVEDLSRVFRETAKEVTPSVVSVVTRGKVVETSSGGNQLDQLFKSDPFMRRFFEMNPQLEEQFRERESTPRQRRMPPGQGSGFVVDAEGYILTNNHVVEDAEQIQVRFQDGHEYMAEVIGTDPRADLALLKIDPPKGLKALPLANSDRVEVGDFVLAVGSPFGLETTVTQGIISAVGRGTGINERENYLQTDAAINPGNSGGPLVNLNGEVIGINTAISSRSGGYDGIGFAIPSNMVRWVSDQLRDKGFVQRAFIGVAMQPLSNEIADQLGIDIHDGVIVNQVMKESPAGKAGVEPGDILTKIAGRDVVGTRELQGIVEQLQIEKTYPLVILRDGETKTLEITMEAMPEDYTLAMRNRRQKPEPKQKKQPSESLSFEDLGLELKMLTPEMAKQFGYQEGTTGVVVSGLKDDSVIADTGIDVGDLIEKVGSKRVRTLEEFDKAMEAGTLEEGILMLVRRGDFTRFVVIKK